MCEIVWGRNDVFIAFITAVNYFKPNYYFEIKKKNIQYCAMSCAVDIMIVFCKILRSICICT